MIQIDIEMPKCCDVCMFSQWSNLSQTASCKLKDYEPCFDDFSKEYKSKRASFCPLHEVTDTDTISRRQAIDALFEILDRPKHADFLYADEIARALDQLPPSPTVTECTDTVSRQAAIKAIRDTYRVLYPIDMISKADAADVLNDLPCVKLSRPHDISKAKFSCPICGAEMEVTVDEWDEGGAV